MADLVTREFRIHNAEQFLEQFGESTPDNIYLFIGRPKSWAVDASPPTLTQTIREIYYNPYENILAMKKVISSDVSYASPRYNWTTGTVYGQYSSDADYFSTQFYVITDEFKVYKCISNNSGATSTNKPTSTGLTQFTLGDGYTWKYMFTLDAVDAVKFLTSDYFPVKKLLSDNGSNQWDVQAAAINGGISYVGVSAGGSAYLTHSGSVVASAPNTVTLAAGASGSNSVYNNYAVYIISGTGAGQIRTISGYVGSTKVATLSANWATNPDPSSVYIVSPRVTAVGNGTGFSAYSEVTTGAVTKINILAAGTGYTQIEASVVGTTGSGATLVPSLSPVGGHGANPVSELLGHNITLNIKMTGTESNLVPVDNDFRVVGLIANPKLAANTAASATSLVYDMTTKLNTNAATGTFVADETITGGTSGATAVIVKRESSTQLSVTSIVGTFVNTEVITGTTSGAVATISSQTAPLVQRYSGKVLYVRNQTPVFRSSDQTEEYKITVRM